MSIDTERTSFEQQTEQAYTKEFAPAVVGYCLITLCVVLLVDFETAGSWKYLVALAPVVPALWGLMAISRHINRVDEFARINMLSAIAFGFDLAMIAAMTLAFLNIAGLESRYWGAWAIYGAGMAGWMIAGMRLQSRNG